MSDRREATGYPPGVPAGARPGASGPGADRERVLLLECRLEQLRSALEDARADADRVRARLAEVAAREADHARRYGQVHEELAEARAEIASLHERLDRSEAFRAELEGHLFEAGARGDAAELVRLRREVLAERQRALVNERTLARLRSRVEELLSSRETLLTRVAEWQRLVRTDGPEAVDLAEFMAELRRDILDLEHRNAAGERQEAALRARLARQGVDPETEHAEDLQPEPPERVEEPAGPAAALAGEDEEVSAGAASPPEPVDAPGVPESAAEPIELDALDAEEPAEGLAAPSDDDREVTAARGPTDFLAVALASSDGPSLRAELLLRLGRSGDDRAVDAVRPWAHAAEPAVRAAAYEALGRLLEGDPSRLEVHLSSGLADPDPRVRRRVVLAAATARRVALRALLDPLRGDPDPQVRRVVREVLRHAPPAAPEADGRRDVVLAAARVASGPVP